MDAMRDVEEDYVRQLREAQERGDRRPVPLIDESRVCSNVKLLTVKQIVRETAKFLSREGLGAVRD